MTANVSSDDQAEMKAADEFVKELFPEESAPQVEHAIKAVVTHTPALRFEVDILVETWAAD